MGNLSLREAVKHYDVSRPTLQKALKSGKITGFQDGQGHWTIDPAELARVYHPRSTEAGNMAKPEQDKLATENIALPGEVDALKAQLAEAEKRAAVAEALAQERADRIADLRRMLPAPDTAKKRRWWSWRYN